jgi:hypothetical protein
MIHFDPLQIMGASIMFIRVPDNWPQPLVAAVAMAVLAALDLAGAYAAKEAVDRRSVGMAALGVFLFVVLFWVFASSLQVAELAPVTFGWVVILQVGVVLLDRFRYGVTLPTSKWVAVAVLLLAQAYLLLGPADGSRSGTSSPEATDKPPAQIPAQRQPPVIDLTGPGSPMRHRT